MTPRLGGSNGDRAARRAGRRRRTWTIVAVTAAAVLVAAAGITAAVTLRDDGSDEAAANTRHRATSSGHSAVTVTTLPSHRCRTGLTPDAPLRLWIAGDSIAYSVGNGLGRRAANTGVVAPVYESRVSSGLSSPGFFDWPRRVAEEVPRLDPEVVVFVMGTNDWMVPQATPVDSTGQPAWKADYARRVQTMVDALTVGGRTLYWVGPPVLRDPKQEAGAREIAAVIRDTVERDPESAYVDAHALLDDEGGGYTPFVEIEGKRVQVRAGDGVHLSDDGADYVGDAIFDRLDALCALRAQAVSGVHQPLVETKGSTSAAPRSGSVSPATVAPTTTPTTPTTVAITPTTVGTTSPTVVATTTPTVVPTTAPPTPSTTTGK